MGPLRPVQGSPPLRLLETLVVTGSTGRGGGIGAVHLHLACRSNGPTCTHTPQVVLRQMRLFLGSLGAGDSPHHLASVRIIMNAQPEVQDTKVVGDSGPTEGSGGSAAHPSGQAIELITTPFTDHPTQWHRDKLSSVSLKGTWSRQ